MSSQPTRRASLRRFSGRVEGVASAKGTWHHRQGVLLRLDDGDFAGYGEASPLPGYSPDSLDEAVADLRRWIDEGCPHDGRGLGSPAARAAAETACWDIRAQQAELPLWQLLRRDGRGRTLPVAGLISAGDVDSTLQRARALSETGITTLKLKVGPDVDVESSRLEALRRDFGDRVRLRLDANRSLPSADVGPALSAWSRYDIEFIEEPTEDLRGVGDSPIPLALDESLHGLATAQQTWRHWSSWIASASCAALVLKPTVLGLETCMVLARLARSAELDVVISHTFEGPPALQACAHLALAVGGPGAQGLARHPGLDAWPPADSLLVSASHIDPSRCQAAGLGLDCEALWAAGEPV